MHRRRGTVKIKQKPCRNLPGQTRKPENRTLRPDRHMGMTGETERNTNTEIRQTTHGNTQRQEKQQ